MSSEDLISELAKGLEPVVPLPSLATMTRRILGLVCVMLGAAFLFEAIAGIQGIHPELSATRFWSIAAHLILGAGGLALALATCIPGRNSVERFGWFGVVLGAGLTIAAVAGAHPFATRTPLDANWLSAASTCLLTALVPALVPAALLALYAARGVPRRPLLTLAYGSVAALSFMTIPGHLGCPRADLLHLLISHGFAPLSAGLPVFATGVAIFTGFRGA
ncbi:MAG: hypothetical protein GY725_15615 [bacterium]|nr:hypothetical protein [bacterium]